MSSPTTPLQEIRELADTMFDGAIEPAGLDRLDELLVTDQSCLQAYLELINLHGELYCQANFHSDEQAALGVLREFSRACDRQERRSRRREFVLLGMCASVVCALFGWVFLGPQVEPAALGSVAFLTSNAAMESGVLNLGDIVHEGRTVSISAGVASIQLGNVHLDLQGPAELTFRAQNQVQLEHGVLAARVLPGGEGFTVRTPDAEVVDLGTEFLVQCDRERGTQVAVRQGRTQVSLLNERGRPTKMVELTAQRSVQVQEQQRVVKEIDYQPEAFQAIYQSRGGIRRMDGTIRSVQQPTASLRAGNFRTDASVLMIPERQNLRLTQDLIVRSVDGETRIPAGSVISSYLIHYDPAVPPPNSKSAPRGAVSFFDKIAAVVVTADQLQATDTLLGLPDAEFESRPLRQLEDDQDEIRISRDRETISFLCNVTPGDLDQARIIVYSGGDLPPALP